jgi:protein-disulfide isomerase
MIDQPHGEKPALTVVIQSWWTPALAVIGLVVGLLGGYFGRPLIDKTPTSNGGEVAAITQTVANPTDQSANPTSTVDPTQQAISVQQMLDSLISQTKNFQGDPNATVTMIEFSDYQ